MKKQGLIPIRPIRPIRHRMVLWGTAIASCFAFISILIIETPLRAPAGKAGSADLLLRSAAVVDDSVTGRAPQAAQPRLATLGKLPLSFEINRGQTDPQVKFLSRAAGTACSSPGARCAGLEEARGQESEVSSAALQDGTSG